MSGSSKREAALEMLEKVPGSGRITVGADRAYDTGTSFGTAERCTSHPTWRRDSDQR